MLFVLQFLLTKVARLWYKGYNALNALRNGSIKVAEINKGGGLANEKHLMSSTLDDHKMVRESKTFSNLERREVS